MAESPVLRSRGQLRQAGNLSSVDDHGATHKEWARKLFTVADAERLFEHVDLNAEYEEQCRSLEQQPKTAHSSQISSKNRT